MRVTTTRINQSISKKNKFKLDLSLPRKQLLLGKYWVRVKLDFGKVRNKQDFMRDGELPTVEYPDKHTVRYSWSKPNPYFLTALAGPLVAALRPEREELRNDWRLDQAMAFALLFGGRPTGLLVCAFTNWTTLAFGKMKA